MLYRHCPPEGPLVPTREANMHLTHFLIQISQARRSISSILCGMPLHQRRPLPRARRVRRRRVRPVEQRVRRRVARPTNKIIATIVPAAIDHHAKAQVER